MWKQIWCKHERKHGTGHGVVDNSSQHPPYKIVCSPIHYLCRICKVVNMRTYKEVSEEQVPTSEQDGGICGLAWCPDGQILTVATATGDVFNFLARMPIVHASCGPCVAYLSSLRQVSVVDVARPGEKPLNVPVGIEPTIVGLGPAHVAVAMNDRVIFYRATRKDKSQVGNCPAGSLRLP